MAALKPSIVKVQLMDGSAKTFALGLTTTARELRAMCIDKLELKEADSFALFERNESWERALEPDEQPAEIQNQWAMERRGKETCEFVFKKKIFLRDDDSELRDANARDLVYYQAVQGVISSEYPCEPDMAVKLAGLQMQVSYRDQKCEKDFLVRNRTVLHFVPGDLLSQKRQSEWESLILKEHQKHHGKTEDEAKTEYLDIVKQWPYYGTTFFPPCKVTGKQKGLPSKVIIGVNAEGLLLLKRDKGLISTHPYTEICSWASSSSTFAFEFGTEGHKYPFETKQGAIIAATIQTYIDILVALLKADSEDDEDDYGYDDDDYDSDEDSDTDDPPKKKK